MNRPIKILCVVGARPNFMKIAPIINVLRINTAFTEPSLIHTGQHYDASMKHCFFEQLGIPEPQVDLEVGSASHAQQTAEIMARFEPVLDDIRPAAVLVVGDVNSTIACGLVAVKKHYPLIHVEAGLRSYDRAMPEEINRVLTDQISDLLFTTERSAEQNLLREGVDRERIHFVGNVMIDSLYSNLDKGLAEFSRISAGEMKAVLGGEQGFALATLHRPANVDDYSILTKLLDIIRQASKRLPILFPLHPRTRQRIEKAGLYDIIDTPTVIVLPPLGYLEMLGLMAKSRLVFTDSGGIQEETTALGVPCITMRENTERPVTVEEGTNTVVGSDGERILSVFEDILETGGKRGRIPELWDGRAAERIASIIAQRFQ